MVDEQVIQGFAKNPSTRVVGILNEYKGRQLAHLREMIATAEPDKWIYGSGVTVPMARAEELSGTVARLADTAALDAVVASMPIDEDVIRVGVQTFKGSQFAYVRRYYEKDGGWLPSKHGVNVRVAFALDLVELAERLASEAQRYLR